MDFNFCGVNEVLVDSLHSNIELMRALKAYTAFEGYLLTQHELDFYKFP